MAKKNMKHKPWVELLDIEPSDIDDHIKRVENGVPMLYLFFKRGNSFDLAEVGADNCVIHLQAANVVNAIITYVAVYFVFHVGYNQNHSGFLQFLEYAFLGTRKIPNKASVGLVKLIADFDAKMETNKKTKTCAKKLCVN